MTLLRAPIPRLLSYSGAYAERSLVDYAAALHQSAGLIGPPYDPLRIAAHFEIRVHVAETARQVRGVLVPLRRGGYTIVVRASDTPAARRFTVAHELVEAGLQVGCPALVERSLSDHGAYREKEQYCEKGAAEIMLPSGIARAFIEHYPSRIAALLPLARTFGASLTAALRRLVILSPDPQIGLILTSAPDGGWLRVDYSCSSPSMVVRRLAGVTFAAPHVLRACLAQGAIAQDYAHLRLGHIDGDFYIEALSPGTGAGRLLYVLLTPSSISRRRDRCRVFPHNMPVP